MERYQPGPEERYKATIVALADGDGNLMGSSSVFGKHSMSNPPKKELSAFQNVLLGPMVFSFIATCIGL